MYIEVNNKPLNIYSIAYFYKDEKDNKYRIVYKTTMGIVEVEEFDTSTDRDDKYDELKEIPIPGGSINLEDKTITITQNGTQTISADAGYDGLNSVEVTTAVSQPSGTISINGNGTYNVADYANANVSVPTEGIAAPNWVTFRNYTGSSLDLSWLRTNNMTSMKNMFSNCSSLTSLDLSNFNTSNVTDMNSMFLTNSLYLLDLSNFNTSNVTNMGSMFSDCQKIVSLDLSSFDTSNVTNMNSMFSYNSKLSTINFGSNFNTSNVIDMGSMFYYCNNSLKTLNLSNFNTSKVTNMSSMFSNCYQITSLDLSSWDTSKVTNMNSMFSSCNALSEIKFGENWISYGTQKYTNQTTGTWTCPDYPGVSYTGLQALLEAGRTKSAIAGTWTKS